MTTTATRLLKWGSHYHLGIEQIDEEHERLALLLNELYLNHRNEEPRSLLGRGLREFIAANAEHFAAEEELMLRIDYPKAPDHKAEHERLARQVTEFQADFEAGRSQLTESMMLDLKDWLRDHMLVSDRRLGEFLRARASRQPLSRAATAS